MFNGKIHYKWSFSIAMLNYQRVIYGNLVCFKHGGPLSNAGGKGKGDLGTWDASPGRWRADDFTVGFNGGFLLVK
jgi:uncharacterized cupin superfamily protein